MEISKMVVDRQKSTVKVVASARTHQDKIQTGVSQLLDESAGRAAALLAETCSDRLERVTAAMVAADEAHIAELGDDAPLRIARDNLSDALYKELTNFREISTTAYGPEYAAALGFEGETPRDPVPQVRLADRVLERLDTVKQPRPRFDGVQFDPTPWNEKLRVPSTDLKHALKAVATEVREAEQTLAAKQQALKNHDDVFAKTATLVSALLRIAGEEALADRVKPTQSRPGRITDPDSELP